MEGYDDDNKINDDNTVAPGNDVYGNAPNCFRYLANIAVPIGLNFPQTLRALSDAWIDLRIGGNFTYLELPEKLQYSSSKFKDGLCLMIW